MINATVGTTVVATVDPIAEIAPIAKKYNLWLHADAALGGPAFFETDRHYRVKGSEHLDSITWDPHKALQIPLQCSLFLTKHDGVLKERRRFRISSLVIWSCRWYQVVRTPAICVLDATI